MLSPRRDEPDLVAGEHVDGRERVVGFSLRRWRVCCGSTAARPRPSWATCSRNPTPPNRPCRRPPPRPTRRPIRTADRHHPERAARRSAARCRPPRDCSASDPKDDLTKARSNSAPPISGLPSATSGAPSNQHPRDARRGSGWRRPMIGCGASISPTAPTRGRSGRRRDAGSAQQSRLFLHAARRLSPRPRDIARPPRARTQRTPTSGIISNCSIRASAAARPSSRRPRVPGGDPAQRGCPGHVPPSLNGLCW